MPQQYHVRKQLDFIGDATLIHIQLNDLTYWTQWFPWRQIDPSIKVTISPPTSGAGAHLSWQANTHYGELTITQSDPQKLTFNLLVNDKHIADGKFNFVQSGNKVYLSAELKGEVATPVIGGYMALLAKEMITNALTSGFNNLISKMQMKSEVQDEKQAAGSQY